MFHWWHHNEPDGVSNHWHLDCLLNHLFRHRSKKTSKLLVTGLCEGSSPVTSEFPAQRTSNVENVSIWWCHHVIKHTVYIVGTSLYSPRWRPLTVKKTHKGRGNLHCFIFTSGIADCLNDSRQYHWNRMVFRVTALVITGDVEGKLQWHQWQPG